MMKRPINLFDCLFLLALTLKLTGTHPIPSWFDVFAVYFFEFLYSILLAYSKHDQWAGKLAFQLWKIKAGRNVKRAAKKAREAMKAGNPGQFHDRIKNPRND